MNDAKLIEWYRNRRDTYEELVNECGSVSELLFRLEVYGDKWTKWDWAMFFKYLDLSYGLCRATYRLNEPDVTPEETLLNDVFREIDSGDKLDRIITNRTVVLNIIKLAGMPSGKLSNRNDMLFRLLAHIFAKFPSLWTMNWMFIRRRSSPLRTHRLAFALNELSGRPVQYFESNAYLDDYVCKFWRIDAVR